MKVKIQKRILVCDDDVAITEALQLALVIFDFNVQTTNLSSKLISLIESFKPDLLILDYFLAGESGTEIAIMLKGMKKFENLKIIMFSAHPAAKDEIDKANVDAFIAKPFDITTLVNKINSLL